MARYGVIENLNLTSSLYAHSSIEINQSLKLASTWETYHNKIKNNKS